MKKPNFFIVGAAKCGTTALYTYLRLHPEVFMLQYNKEPHYFASDLHRNKEAVRQHKWIINRSEYLALFEEADEAVAVGEASVYYLYSETAAAEIYRFNPDSKIIVMLRHPVDMIYSLHQQRIYSMVEDTLDFTQALDIEKNQRDNGKKSSHEVKKVGAYLDVALYSDQVKRFLSTFPREQIHIILYDDFKHDTERIYRDTLKFLNVDESFQIEFAPVNKGKIVHSQFAQRIILARPNLIIKPLHAIMPKWLRHHLAMLLINLNIREIVRPPLDPELRENLITHFKEDILELSALIDIDLSMWLK